MNRLLPLCLLVAALLLTACGGEVNLLDETKLRDISLMTGEPCEAPCWQGITPDETSYRDAKLIIEGDERFKIVEEPEPQEDSLARSFTFAEGENPGCCQVVSRDGENVSSFLLQTAPVMTFGPVYDRYGEPNYAIGQQVSEEQGYVALMYTERSLVIYAFVANPAGGSLATDSPIIGLLHLGASELQQLLECTSLFEWAGFTSFTSYSGEDYNYVGEGVGDEEACPTN
ncbi:MAG: hypothetical protein OXI62_03315 [Chloroflexota bacterium]|nr:hypothetical protein [Chloroflexota bacterium]MCY3581582.1 hypothetical protein [Chloroflexota bacterium]MDE2649731.1 hypothetical protein [Chloroflexota bacterium]MXV92158.1 hypothetical protein [Chloroflexota bacterium]MXX51706.1 hypothetical protein [Chloroflexota bacterium]